MTKLDWDVVGTRFFETGVDRGVLYPKVGPGLPWNGLVSVTDKVSGGEPTPYYQDGLKYLNISSVEEFEATIQAFSSPPEFDISEGLVEIATGLSGAQQPRQPFGFSYRTMVGDDLVGADYGYLIHLVYGALANPTSRDNGALGDTPSPMLLSWDIETLAPAVTGYRPSAHLIVDSTLTPPAVLAEVESYLYGTLGQNPVLLSPTELVTLFS